MLRISQLIVAGIACGAAHTASPSHPPKPTPAGLCQAGEVVLFRCDFNGKAASLCGHLARRAEPSATYRFGTRNRLELVHTAARSNPTGFSYANFGYAGGGETQIYFENHGYRYVLYDRIVRTAFGPDGLHDPKATAGITVYRAGKIVGRRICSNDLDAAIMSGRLEGYIEQMERRDPEGT